MVEESGSNPKLEKEQHSTSPFHIIRLVTFLRLILLYLGVFTEY